MASTDTRRKEREKRRARRDREAAQKAPKNGASEDGAKGGPSKQKAAKGGWRETLRFWAISIVVILIVRAFLFEPYRIPSESMEDTLLVGDFLIVSKLHYGARTPNTIGIPFTRMYLRGVELPQTRLPGFSEVERGDVIVFNYPAALDVERGMIPATTPIERRDPYIKRVIGMPGDTVSVLDKVVHLNGVPQDFGPTMKLRWLAEATGDERPSVAELAEMDLLLQGEQRTPDGLIASPRRYTVIGTQGAVEALEARPDVARVVPDALPDEVTLQMRFPPNSQSNPDQFGPVVVPQAGVTVPVSPETWPGLEEIVTRYEGHEAEVVGDSVVVIDGQPVSEYTFAQNYYFVMGDFRDNSVDSRYWGFVPEDHVLGKASFLFISLEKFLPPIPRLSRFFRPIR